MTFTQWYQKVCSKLTKSGQIKSLEKEFVTQTNDFDRVSLLYQNQDLLNEDVRESFHRKDNKQSESYRNIGNKLYSSSSFQNAIQAYTRAIKHAEYNSKTLSLAYANRSAVLFAMGELSFCRADILLALECGYPKELHHKLYERIGKCYQKKGLNEQASSSFKNSLKSIKASKLTTEKQEEKIALLNSLIEKCNIMDSSNEDFGADLENHIYTPNLPVLYDHNETYLSASQSFSMKSDKVHGRYAVATKDIRAGEVIVIEKPFASVCLPNCYDTHCYHCLNRFKFAYPCRNCSSIGYCSIECESKSWESFHQYECSYMNLLINDDVGLGHLAMKVVLKNTIEDLKQFQELYVAKQNEFGLSDNNVFDPQSYFCLFSLVGNSDLRKHSDLFRRSLLAIFLTKILQSTGYVGISDEKAQIAVAGHLLKQIQMLPCNAHEVSEAQLNGFDLASNELKEIGSAAYTTLSLLNHSCDPSVVRHCYRDMCVVRALKHIKEGEEIIDNYGFLYAVQEKTERQQQLEEQYYFTCQCTPCIENWPLYQSLKDNLPTFRCSFCPSKIDAKTYKCCSCGIKDDDVLNFYKGKKQELYESTVQKVLNSKGSDIESNLEILLDYLDLLTKKAELPNIHVNNCQEVVKLCFSLSANFARL